LIAILRGQGNGAFALGRGTPERLNDDRLGRVLDALYLSGLSKLFIAICLML
jgi:hypothetical protein